MALGALGSGGGTTVAAGGTGAQGLLSKFLKQFTDQSNQARADSLSQYNNLLSSVDSTKNSVLGPGGLYSQAMGNLDTVGKSGMDRIAQGETNNYGKAEQDLINRGLGNTTLRTGALAGVSHNAELERQSLNESLAMQKTNLLGQQAGASIDIGRLGADAILSRQNLGPDTGTYLSILQQLGQTLGQQTADNQPNPIYRSQNGSINGPNNAVGGGTSFGGGGSMGGGGGSMGGGGGGGGGGTSGGGSGSFYAGPGFNQPTVPTTPSTPTAPDNPNNAGNDSISITPKATGVRLYSPAYGYITVAPDKVAYYKSKGYGTLDHMGNPI